MDEKSLLELRGSEGIKDILTRAILRRKQTIVYTLARQFYSALESHGLYSSEPQQQNSQQWIPIESLSQLRSVVGGRFQNLKQRWTAAGFPLREHRGDRNSEAVLDYEGWVELASWIHKQGFEVRLAGEGSEFLFEVRKGAEGND